MPPQTIPSLPAERAGDRRPVKMRANQHLHRSARFLSERGATANGVSLGSIGCAVVAAAALVMIPVRPEDKLLFSLIASVAILARGLCNLLDGLIAIENKRATATGAFYNEAPDRLSDALILVGAGLAWRLDATGLSAGLLLSLLAIGTAYIRALGKTLTGEDDFRGPMAKPHRIAILSLSLPVVALLPSSFCAMEIVLTVLAGGTLLTIATRSRHLLATLNHNKS